MGRWRKIWRERARCGGDFTTERNWKTTSLKPKMKWFIPTENYNWNKAVFHAVIFPVISKQTPPPPIYTYIDTFCRLPRIRDRLRKTRFIFPEGDAMKMEQWVSGAERWQSATRCTEKCNRHTNGERKFEANLNSQSELSPPYNIYYIYVQSGIKMYYVTPRCAFNWIVYDGLNSTMFYSTKRVAFGWTRETFPFVFVVYG